MKEFAIQIRLGDNYYFKRVKGYSVTKTAFVYKSSHNFWIVTDKKTGMKICEGDTKKSAIERFNDIQNVYLRTLKSDYYKNVLTIACLEEAPSLTAN